MEGTAPEVIRLFPTFVWRRQLEQQVYGPLNRGILATLDELMKSESDTPGSAWQSRHGLHKLPEFGALVAHVDTEIRSVLAFLKIRGAVFRITGCWANVLAPGAAHAMHSHPNNFLSGVYYVQVPSGADTINFHDPRPQTAIIRPPVVELTAYNNDQTVVCVNDGTLLVFPAWLPHSVSSNSGRERRISVSFNVMFVAYEETMSPPLWSGL